MASADWTRPRVSPSLAPLVDDPRAMIWPPREGQSLESYRLRLDAPLAAMQGPPVQHVAELVVDRANGADIPLRLYLPSDEGGLPVIVFLHGGGFVAGSLETHDALCRTLAIASGAAVISVGYRLAPEAPFPAPLDDCIAALRWISVRAGDLKLDGRRIALCGDSAGGQLAIATGLAVRADGPRLCHLGLVYPVVDPACASASAEELGVDYLLSRRAMQWFWRCYGGDDPDRRDPLFAVMAGALHGLPSTTVLTAEFDPLRDEGEALARKLEADGVVVAARRYQGMTHGFASLGLLTATAGRAISDLAADIAASFAERG